jgi:hypothetical protein
MSHVRDIILGLSLAATALVASNWTRILEQL